MITVFRWGGEFCGFRKKKERLGVGRGVEDEKSFETRCRLGRSAKKTKKRDELFRQREAITGREERKSLDRRAKRSRSQLCQ